MKHIIMLVLVCSFVVPSLCHGRDILDQQFDNGIRNAEAYARILIAQARTNKTEASELLKRAVAAAPDLPLVYFEMARNSFEFSLPGILDWVDFVVQGLNAYGRNFWWSLTLWGSLFFAGVLSFLLAVAILCCVRILPDLPLLFHDVREHPSRIALFFVMVILALISPLLFIAAVLILLGIYMKPSDKVIVYSYLAFLLISPLLYKTASMFLQAYSSGSLKAIVQVNEARDNTYASTALKDARDYPSLFSYALARKRLGQYDEALPLFRSLTEMRRDPRAYVNLGNCFIGQYALEEGARNRLEEAAKIYFESINLKPLASAYYNLSQVYREMLDFPKGEEFFSAAIAIDRIAVAQYRAVSGKSPNRLVADEPLTRGDFWDYIGGRFTRTSTLGTSVVSPGILAVFGLVLGAAFYLMNSQFRVHAHRCRKCGTIICEKCEDRLMWGQMCVQCFSSLVKLEETDARERIARILAIYEQQRRRRGIIKVLSLLLPGTSFIYGGRLLPGFLVLWPFLFLLLIPVSCVLLVPASRLVVHTFISWGALILAGLLYIAGLLITRKRMAHGWL